jgi:O-antigen/teichoic acid export membrane protein
MMSNATVDGNEADILHTAAAGPAVIRGGAARAAGYALGVGLAAVTSVFLLRYLGVVDFGRYMTVAALIGIVSGVSDAGLTAVGARELSTVPAGAQRSRLLASLISLRIAISAAGVLAAAVFALVAGYGETLVYGTLLAGLGALLVNVQATTMLPLSVELRVVRVTAVEVLKQALTLAGVVALVVAGASLLTFFAVQIGVGVVVLAMTPLLYGTYRLLRPSGDLGAAWALLRQALPMAAVLAMNVIYFRVLLILVSLIATATATGLFATSFRVFEVVVGLPTLVLSVSLPVLSVAAAGDDERLAYGLQRMTEVALVVSVWLVLAIVILAEPAIRLVAGAEFVDAAPVLQIQSFALVGVFLGQTWQLGLFAMRRQAELAGANAFALVLVVGLGLALIPDFGAEGAAVAAVIAEAALAAALLALLVRARRAVAPSLRFTPRLALAAAAGAAMLLLPLAPLPTAVLATAAYAAVAIALGVVPREFLRLGRV